MTTLRCAYFGCMHPLFDSSNGRKKYCSAECMTKANHRGAAARRSRAKFKAKLDANPDLKKQRALKYEMASYRNGHLPKWMYS